MKIKIIWAIVFCFLSTLILIIYLKDFQNKKKQTQIKKPNTSIFNKSNSNTFVDVNYSSEDSNGNKYIIRAKNGEVDYSNPNIIFLEEVDALIKLKNSNNIKIKSEYGKYNSENLDTIFSKNVIITYLENEISGEYLDFSMGRNSMIISRDVIYNNIENVLKADVVEIEIDTKNTKIFMYDKKKKINIQSKNINGNN
jgi:hypothetical protein